MERTDYLLTHRNGTPIVTILRITISFNVLFREFQNKYPLISINKGI